MTYGITENYLINEGAGDTLYSDTWENSKQYQFWVYHQVKQLAEPGCSLLDLGCGYGWKLCYWIKDTGAEITGIDLPEVIEYCKAHHQFGTWVAGDLSLPTPEKGEGSPTYDLIVCSDVVEHVENPDHLLDWVRYYAHEGSLIVFSTPNRDLIYGENHCGPPGNPSHYREWNWDEFAAFIRTAGFTILSHSFVVAKKEQKEVPVNQMIVAIP